MKISKILAITVSLFCAGQLLAESTTVEQATLSDAVLNISENFIIAGALNHSVVTTLSRDTILIDLRTAPEGTAEERVFVEGQGLQYENFPIGKDGLGQSQLDGFAKVISDNPDSPVVLYCRSGNRASLLYAAHLVETGQDVDAAWEVVKPLARPEIEKALRAFVAK
jgi:uncharacterized protein (TIGR01244 family)